MKTYKVTVDGYGTIRWKNENGELHRENGPAVERASGYKAYYINGKLHREDGPAIEFANGDKYYFVNGLLHREDGPAVENVNGDKYYYLNGRKYFTRYSYEKWLNRTNKAKELTVKQISDLLGYDVKIVKES